MAVRVTEHEVKEIIETTLTDLSPFITAANLIVTQQCGGQSMAAALLKEIERWVAAHLVSVRERSERVTRVKIGEAEEQYSAPSASKLGVGDGLATSPYGQQALMLDYSGKLRDLGKKRAVLYSYVIYDETQDTNG
jgi:hypothetical protein